MAQEIIGREPEIKEIEALYQTNKPVFAVVYGRRRVGKTFLIRELLGDKFAFYHTGLSPYELQGKKLKEQQLSNFLLFAHQVWQRYQTSSNRLAGSI